MGWYARKPDRPTQAAHAPLCSWPAGCRKGTWDLSGRCPHHRHHNATPTVGAAAPTAAGNDPLAAPPAPSAAEALAEADGNLPERVAVILADRGITPATLPMWQQATGGDNEVLVAALDSGVTADNLHYFTSDETSEDDSRWAHDLPLRVYAYWDTGNPARTFHASSIIEWRDAEPGLDARSIRDLIDAAKTPTDDSYLAYTAAGVPPDRVLAWESAKVAAEDAGTWHRLGVTPKDAAETQSYGRTAAQIYEAAATCPAAYLPPEAAGWRTWGPSERAEMWAAGITAEDAADYHRANLRGVAAGQLARVGVTPTDYRKWRRGPGSPRSGNLNPAEIARLVDAGASLDDIDQYRRYGVPKQRWQAAAEAGAVGDELLPTLLAPGSIVRRTVISSPNLAPTTVAALVAAHDADTAEAAASNPACPPAALEKAALRPANPASDAVLRGGARHPDATAATLTAASAAADPTTRLRAASHTNTPPDTLTVLAADARPEVRAAAAANPNTPKSGTAAAGLLND